MSFLRRPKMMAPPEPQGPTNEEMRAAKLAEQEAEERRKEAERLKAEEEARLKAQAEADAEKLEEEARARRRGLRGLKSLLSGGYTGFEDTPSTTPNLGG